LQVLNVDYDMLDLNKSATGWSKYKQIWVFSTDEMNAPEQQKIVDYFKNGGNIVLYPNMPVREMNGTICNIIRDAVGIKPIGTDAFDSALIDVLGIKDIKCANPQIVYNPDDLKDAQIIAQNIRGKIVGFSKKIGKGTFAHIGTWWGFDTETHKDVYQKLLKLSDAKLYNAESDNYFVNVRERFTPAGEAVLFVGNYYNEEHSASITYTHPATGEMIKMPISAEKLEMPNLYAILSPIGLKLSENLQLLHTTSDVLNIEKSENEWSIQLFGHRDLLGELVLEGAGIQDISSVHSNEISTEFRLVENKLVVTYQHLHKKDFKLKIVGK